MEASVSNRIIDFSALDKLSTIVSIAKEHGLAISIDFIGDLWIVQMFDQQERLVISANADNPSSAISKVHENWLRKTAPKI